MDITTMTNRYLAGESTQNIAEDAQVSRQTVTNRLRKAGVEIRTSGGKITRDQGRRIAEEYAAGESSTLLASRYGITHDAVLGCCRRHGAPIRTRGDYPSTRVHHFREDFFSTWTPDMAYVLGLVATDGSVQPPGTLRIYQKETGLLDQVQQAFDSSVNYDLCGTPDNPIPTLRIHSRKVVADLGALGIHPNKSRTIRAPSEVPFPQDYIRGIFDGDGHGGFYLKRGRPQLRIGFTSGSRDFLVDIQRILPVPIGGPYENRGCWSLQTSREEHAIILRDWMYEGQSPIHSTRKRRKLYRK